VSEEDQRPPERSRRLPRAVRERQILDAAVQVFARHGYHAASMDEISDVAGVSKPMIYTYLGSKEDLFGACIRREATRLLEAIQAGVQPDLPPDMQLWHGLRSFYRFVADVPLRWSDFDSAGVVNNSIYLTLMEQARFLYFQHLGFLSDHKVPFVLAEATVKFLRPGHLGMRIEF